MSALGVCHEHRHEFGRCATVRGMKEGLSSLATIGDQLSWVISAVFLGLRDMFRSTSDSGKIAALQRTDVEGHGPTSCSEWSVPLFER
jgi:hypothetical protein